MLFFGSRKKTKDNESLNDPDALTHFYMDTFMCTDYQLRHAICMEEYSKYRVISFSKRKKYKECINYFDEYKACLIGINHQSTPVRRNPTAMSSKPAEKEKSEETNDRIKL